MSDDRIYTTEFADGVELPGVHDASEFHVWADQIEGCGCGHVAALLRGVTANVKWEEPTRKHGWSGGSNCNVLHFYRSKDADGPLCRRRIIHRWREMVWYPSGFYPSVCQECLRRLRGPVFAKEFPRALAAIELRLSERQSAWTEL